MRDTHLRLADCFDDWRNSLLTGTPPEQFAVADNGPLTELNLCPGRVWVIGGHPGAGKTAFVMQLVIDALSLQKDVGAIVMNVEMDVGTLLDRQLARLSGIPLRTIQRREFDAQHRERLDFGFDSLADIRNQLTFTTEPYHMDRLIQAADAVSARIVIADYIQRIQLNAEPPADRRANIDACMNRARAMANCGLAVIVVAALARQKSQNGSDYDNAGLASFRESSELEYGADDAFILTEGKPGQVVLKHVKSRHGARTNLSLAFDGSLQRFESVDVHPAQAPDISRDISALWES